MTILPPGNPIIPPVRPFPFDTVPYTNVTPLTFRDTATMIQSVELVKKWLREDLIPHVDTAFTSIVEQWVTNIEQIVSAVNTNLDGQIETVNGALDAQAAAVNAALQINLNSVTTQLGAQNTAVADQLSANLTAVNAAIATIVNSTIAVSDPVVAGVLDGSPTNQTNSRIKTRIQKQAVQRRVHVFDVSGQSNPCGRASAFGTAAGVIGADPVHPRIYQYSSTGPNAHQFFLATEPMWSHEGKSKGMGPALQFARQLIKKLPNDDIIVLVMNPHGGTMMSTDATPLGWRWGVAGNLSAQEVALTAEALAAAPTFFEGATAILRGVIMWQGETDGTNATPPTTYQADWDAWAAGIRGAYGIPTLPIVLCQMIPESLGNTARGFINQVHLNTPYRVANTGIVLNSVLGHAEQDGQNLHADAYAMRNIYGPGILAELERIEAGLLPTTPNPYTVALGPVAGLAAGTVNAHSVALSWTALEGAAKYSIEYQEPGSTDWIKAIEVTGANAGTLGALLPTTAYNASIVPIDADGKAGFRSPALVVTTGAATTDLTDSFNRAAGALGNADSGQAWNLRAGGAGSGLTDGTRGYHGSTSNTLWDINAGQADGIVQITLAVMASFERLWFRGDGTKDNGWFVQERLLGSGAYVYQLYKAVLGSLTQDGENSPYVTPAAGDVISVSYTGPQICVRVNGKFAFRRTDAHQQAGTYVGIGGSSANTARFDDLTFRH